jgi:hypothetical protein
MRIYTREPRLPRSCNSRLASRFTQFRPARSPQASSPRRGAPWALHISLGFNLAVVVARNSACPIAGRDCLRPTQVPTVGRRAVASPITSMKVCDDHTRAIAASRAEEPGLKVRTKDEDALPGSLACSLEAWALCRWSPQFAAFEPAVGREASGQLILAERRNGTSIYGSAAGSESPWHRSGSGWRESGGERPGSGVRDEPRGDSRAEG